MSSDKSNVFQNVIISFFGINSSYVWMVFGSFVSAIGWLSGDSSFCVSFFMYLCTFVGQISDEVLFYFNH